LLIQGLQIVRIMEKRKIRMAYIPGSLKHLATVFRADREFQKLGWRRGKFFLAFGKGWMRNCLSGLDNPHVRPFVVRHGVSGQSCTLHMRMSPGVGDWIVLRGVWLQQEYFHPVISQCQTILDVGANIGMAAVWFKGLNPKVILACVEPDPRNLPLLRLNLIENGIDPRIFDCAVAPRTGYARFGTGVNHGWSSLENAGLHNHDRFVQVKMRRIPDILDDLGWSRVDLLKLDVEGLERDLFTDADDWLSRIRLILFELHPNNLAEEIAAIFSRASWSMERIGYLGDPTYLAKAVNG
jgi:FkbM family methyltransferase